MLRILMAGRQAAGGGSGGGGTTLRRLLVHRLRTVSYHVCYTVPPARPIFKLHWVLLRSLQLDCNCDAGLLAIACKRCEDCSALPGAAAAATAGSPRGGRTALCLVRRPRSALAVGPAEGHRLAAAAESQHDDGRAAGVHSAALDAPHGAAGPAHVAPLWGDNPLH